VPGRIHSIPHHKFPYFTKETNKNTLIILTGKFYLSQPITISNLLTLTYTDSPHPLHNTQPPNLLLQVLRPNVALILDIEPPPCHENTQSTNNQRTIVHSLRCKRHPIRKTINNNKHTHIGARRACERVKDPIWHTERSRCDVFAVSEPM
jgi:hypothetical protein